MPRAQWTCWGSFRVSTWVLQAAHGDLSFGFVLPHPSSSSQITPNPSVPLLSQHCVPYPTDLFSSGISVPSLCSLLPAAKPDLNQQSSCLSPIYFPFLSMPGSYSSWNGCCQLGLGQEPERSSSCCKWGFSFHSSSWKEPHSILWRRKPGRHPGMFGQGLQQ